MSRVAGLSATGVCNLISPTPFHRVSYLRRLPNFCTVPGTPPLALSVSHSCPPADASLCRLKAWSYDSIALFSINLSPRALKVPVLSCPRARSQLAPPCLGVETVRLASRGHEHDDATTTLPACVGPRASPGRYTLPPSLWSCALRRPSLSKRSPPKNFFFPSDRQSLLVHLPTTHDRLCGVHNSTL